MKLYAPKYYDNFICKADKCNHSCCVGWEIDVDSKTLNKYSTLSCEYAANIVSSIDYDPTPHFRLTNMYRCPHLDENGLCRIIKNVGEEYLCDICREHPRFYNFTNRGKELGIGISCEEACKIVLESDDFDKFILLDTDPIEPDIADFDAIIERSKIYDILKSTNLKPNEKIEKICEEYNIELKQELIIEAIANLEYLDNDHKILFEGVKDLNISFSNDKKIERLLAYFIYRHCSEAITIDEFALSLSFSVACTMLIASLSVDNDIYDISRIVSEEIEYSTDNIEILKNACI